MEKCKDYLHMLLLTGFHNQTNPEVFRKNLEEIKSKCPNNLAKHTKKFISNENFNSYRYEDMKKLLTTLSADLVLSDPDIVI